jgi:hypothetical protein
MESNASKLETTFSAKNSRSRTTKSQWVYSILSLLFIFLALIVAAPDRLRSSKEMTFLLGLPLPHYSYLVCILLGFVLFPLSKYLFAGRSIYGYEHACLNVQVPPPTMWMNMGYWKVFAVLK